MNRSILQQAIRRIVEGERLSALEAQAVCEEIIGGRATPPQIAGLLVALRARGETVDEFVGFAQAMRAAARPLDIPITDLVDTCGTGGDGLGTFNISTVSAFVAAGAGCTIAKHGNRWISGKCGSADVLEALGVRVEIEPDIAVRCIREVGIGFLFAPLYHEGTRHAGEARRAVGMPSIFNVLGPLANPAGARRQLVGVNEARLVGPVAESLQRLGAERALVVHGEDGLDEITPCSATRIAELRDGVIREYVLAPQDLNLEPARLEELAGGDAAGNAAVARKILGGAPGGARLAVLANAGAAVYLAGRADTLADGVQRAAAAIDSGAAATKLEQLAALTRSAS